MKLTLDDSGEFSWNFNKLFFIETNKGNFVWSDPDYNGDNTIKPFDGTLKDFLKQQNIPCVRDKGFHTIRHYCGDNVKIME